MKFEENPVDGYEHGLVFEAGEGEVEAIASTYREIVNHKIRDKKFYDIKPHERTFAKWGDTPDRTIYTSHPMYIASLLAAYHARTQAEVERLVAEASEPAFDSDAAARRIDLGEKALQLAGIITLEFDSDSLEQMLDDQGADLFTSTKDAPKNPRE